MTTNELSEKTKDKLRTIMRDHQLAKFGDSVTNFIYSLAKTEVYKEPFGEKVYDKALAEALRRSGLRELMPSSLNSGELGDGVEALIGYTYMNKIMTIDEFKAIINRIISKVALPEFEKRSREREIIALAFKEILAEIISRLKEL
ncbi:MAG: hypothetical protein FK734_02705 [Asgard group archaeon]|nr:hypothetical protein [Asgard group archaeon]